MTENSETEAARSHRKTLKVLWFPQILRLASRLLACQGCAGAAIALQPGDDKVGLKEASRTDVLCFKLQKSHVPTDIRVCITDTYGGSTACTLVQVYMHTYAHVNINEKQGNTYVFLRLHRFLWRLWETTGKTFRQMLLAAKTGDYQAYAQINSKSLKLFIAFHGMPR